MSKSPSHPDSSSRAETPYGVQAASLNTLPFGQTDPKAQIPSSHGLAHDSDFVLWVMHKPQLAGKALQFSVPARQVSGGFWSKRGVSLAVVDGMSFENLS